MWGKQIQVLRARLFILVIFRLFFYRIRYTDFFFFSWPYLFKITFNTFRSFVKKYSLLFFYERGIFKSIFTRKKSPFKVYSTLRKYHFRNAIYTSSFYSTSFLCSGNFKILSCVFFFQFKVWNKNIQLKYKSINVKNT